MEKKEIKTGMTVLFNGRRSVVGKIKGSRAKVTPFGEGGRWAEIKDLEKA